MRQLSINSHENNENKKQDMNKIKIDNETKSKKNNKVFQKQSSKDVADFKYNNNAHVNDLSKQKFLS